jgi:hypothetical protein
MFDSFKWSWEYEPYDLDGYIPDFVLIFSTGLLLVEIKPDMQISALRRHASKVDRSGWEDKAVILGGTPFLDGEREKIPQLFGWAKDTAWAPAALFRCGKCRNISFSSSKSGSRCYVKGCLGYSMSAVPRLEAMWGKAHNLTKWTG